MVKRVRIRLMTQAERDRQVRLMKARKKVITQCEAADELWG
jgi:hypothetical protein